MLRLEINSDITGFLQELQDMMNGHASLLAKTQRGDPVYKDSLGWLDTGICAGERELERIEKKAAQIRMRADAFVLIGVGGSNNAARSVIEGVAHRSGCDVIYAGNTLHPRALREMLQKLDGRDFYIDCIAKNFETLEPASAFRVLRQYMDSRYGASAAERVIATGTPGSSLWRLCQEEGDDFFDFPETVGGRYSAVTNVGLLPMAAAGIDVRELVKGANDMQMQLRSLGPQENPAYRYACLRRLFDRHGYHMEMLSSFEPELRYFYLWWKQLFAESEGKDGKGVFPVTGEFSEELHSTGQYIQDGPPAIFETFLDFRQKMDSFVIEPDSRRDGLDYLDGLDFYDINKAAQQATIRAHSEKLPVMTISAEAPDAYNFGQLFYFFEFACALSCGMLGVNPFDQPGVEAYKQRMFKLLGKTR